MTEQELEKIVKYVNETIEMYIATDEAETNNAIAKGFFDKEDLLNVVSIDDEPESVWHETQKELIDRKFKALLEDFTEAEGLQIAISDYHCAKQISYYLGNNNLDKDIRDAIYNYYHTIV